MEICKSMISIIIRHINNASRDADKVDDLLDSIQEQKDLHDTIAEAISKPGQDAYDDVSSLLFTHSLQV